MSGSPNLLPPAKGLPQGRADGGSIPPQRQCGNVGGNFWQSVHKQVVSIKKRFLSTVIF